jgi:hypothetical protein
VSALAVEIKMATFTGSERARCVFWFKETKSATPSISRDLPVGLQFTRVTRILLRPNVLCAMQSHPVCPCVSFEVHERQRYMCLGKLVSQKLLCGFL